MDIQSVELVIPVFNEAKYLEKFINELSKEINRSHIIRKVIFVNDGSTDNSLKIIENLCKKNRIFHLINLKNNLGKGHAMSKGFSIAKRDRSDCVIFMDSDGQHNPRCIKSFIKRLQKE